MKRRGKPTRAKWIVRGALLLLLALGVAAALQDGVVRLEATLNAAPFYARHGFVETGRAIYQHPLGGLPVEIVQMVFYVPK